MADVKRYAIVGTGSRAGMYFRATTETHTDVAELVGLCDVSQARMNLYNRRLAEWGTTSAPTFLDTRFDEMVRQTRPDKVIVTTRDCFHDLYIIRAMQLGCDVITEKPMTTDDAKCRAILDAVERTGRKLTVTFNYRYSPKRSKVKELLTAGVIGRVQSVDFEWLLDTSHGADYFRRWHRQKANSGGLLVHKATHHFDLVNWWIASAPAQVFATGRLCYYGDKNGNAPVGHGVRCHTCPVTGQCKFYLNLAASRNLRQMYLEAEPDNGYIRDQCVFGEGITIEDSMAVNVRYENGALMSYSLNAFMPYEGSRIAFNGDRGRLEFEDIESSYVAGRGGQEGATIKRGARIRVFPHFAAGYEVNIDEGAGGHGGGDTLLLDDLFRGVGDDTLGRAADHIDGARSILTGIAANQSMASGQPVRIADLVQLPNVRTGINRISADGG